MSVVCFLKISRGKGLNFLGLNFPYPDTFLATT